MHNKNTRIYRAMRATATTLTVGLTAFGCRKDAEQPEKARRDIPVRVQTVREMTFRRELTVQGSLESERFALVPAEMEGTIKRLLVNEGDAVTNGQPLCELDGEILRRAVENQEQGVAVAGNALAVSLAQEERTRADDELAGKDLQRFSRLAEENAVTMHRLDESKRNAKMAAAAHKVALAQVDLSRARLKQAETALAIARRNLDDATVCAPIAGRISLKCREQGEMVHVGDPVFRIDDPTVLAASVFLPAQAYGDVVPGRTLTHIRMGGIDLGERPVSYRSPTVDERMRTFEVKARIENPPAGVVAGGLADVRVVFAEREGRGVPASALVTRGGKAVVFVENGGAAHRAEVQTGLQTDSYLEITDGIDAGAVVIVQGQHLMNDGNTITVVED